jgi:hypothetical protein
MATKEEIAAAAAAKGTETLPPAGHGRDEALKLRAMTLEEEAEQLAEQMIVGEIPEKFQRLDREIVQKLEQLDVSDKREDMHYVWVNFVNDHGQHIERKKLVGFEVVTGTGEDCPEGHELLTADGTRQIGDVLLMRVPRTRAVFLKARERKIDLERRGVLRNPDALAEMAFKHTGGRIKIHTQLSEEHKQIAERRVEMRYQRMQQAYTRLGQQLEGGKVLHEGHFAGRV